MDESLEETKPSATDRTEARRPVQFPIPKSTPSKKKEEKNRTTIGISNTRATNQKNKNNSYTRCKGQNG
jgi:hypothetical protein